MSELEQRNKPSDDAIDKMNKLMQKWKDRLTVDNLRLSERYLKGEVEVIVHLWATFPGDAGYFCSILKNWESSGSSENRMGDSASHVLMHLRSQSPNRRLPCQDRREGGGITEIELPEAERHDQQEAVLVDIVKFVECPKIVAPTLVRLERVNKPYRSGIHSLYLSRRFGFVLGRSLADGKIGPVARGIPVCLNQLPSQVVERTAQLVDGFPDDQGEVFGWLRPNLDPKDALAGLRVLVAQHAIWVSFAEGQNPSFKITDVVFGPFDFRPNAE
jgi:hypothetical protein